MGNSASVRKSHGLLFKTRDPFFSLSPLTRAVTISLCCFLLKSFIFRTKSSRFIYVSRSFNRSKLSLPSSLLCSRKTTKFKASLPIASSSLVVRMSRHKNFIDSKFLVESSLHRENINFLYSEISEIDALTISKLKIVCQMFVALSSILQL